MNKVGIIVVALLLSISLPLIASGAKEAAKGPVKISYWHYQPTPSRKEIETGNIAKFQELNPGITVEYIPVPWEQAHEKYITSIAAKNAADVMMVPDFWVAEFAAMGALENLEPYLAKWEHRDDFVPLALAGARLYKNTAYWMPTDLMTSALYYRIDWFNAAGIAKAPETWDEMLAAAKKLTDPGSNRYGFGMRGGRGGERYWLTWMLMRNNAKFFDDEGNCTLNQAGPVQALGWFADLYRKHKVTPPTAPTDVYKQMVGAFGSGITAMYIHNNGSMSDQLRDLGEGKFMTAPLPKGPDGYRVSKNMPNGYAMSSQSKNKDAAWKYLGYLGGPIGNSYRESKVGTLPVNRKVYEEAWLKDNKYSKAFEVELLGDPKYIFIFPAYLPEWGGLVETFLTPEYQKVLLGEQSEQDAANHIAAKFTDAQKKWMKTVK